ncbi:hypothetical protein ES703_50926 [subsurface metagenome]
MTKEQWEQIKYFSPNENWGNPCKMSFELLKRLDALREFVSHRIIIHCGYAGGGHTENSQHYLGKAVDFHIENMSLINQYLAAERFMFTGIGIYPDWNNPGLHCDVRCKSNESPQDRWAKLNKKYIPLTENVIKKIIQK